MRRDGKRKPAWTIKFVLCSSHKKKEENGGFHTLLFYWGVGVLGLAGFSDWASSHHWEKGGRAYIVELIGHSLSMSFSDNPLLNIILTYGVVGRDLYLY